MTAFYRCILIAFVCLAAALHGQDALAASAAEAHSHDTLTKNLHAFGLDIAEKYNKHVKGSKAKKDVVKNADGTWTAVYHEIDPQSIRCSYRDSSNPKGPVRYIGTLHYAEVKHVCTAPSKAAAEKGPFTQHRTGTTELVKYVKGKWTY